MTVPHHNLHQLLKVLFLWLLLVSVASACIESNHTVSLPDALPANTAVPTTVPSPTPIPTSIPTTLGEYELLAPEDMQDDLDELFHRIETTHPDPYARFPKAQADLERERIEGELVQPLTLVEFFKKVAPIVNALGDPHTRVFLPGSTFAMILEKETFLPFSVKFEGDKALILADLSGRSDIPAGSVLLSINGTDAAAIQAQLEPLGLYEYPFTFAMWFLYGSIPGYQVEYIRPGETIPVSLQITSMTGPEIMLAQGPGQPVELVSYSEVPGWPVGVLTVNGFQGTGPLLKEAFAQIMQDGVQLVIDIRQNRGGKYDEVTALMDYLTGEPYRICAKKYQAPFGGYGSGEPRETECELVQPVDVAERYQGRLYLLVGPDTFSAAITLATILQDKSMAVLVGEETKDQASYCADVVLEGMPLPHTGLVHMISRTCYVRPSGVLDENGVVPDFIVKTTLEDVLAGKDPVMEAALELTLQPLE